MHLDVVRICDFMIRAVKTTKRKEVRMLCPEGYEKPGWTYELGKKNGISYR